MNSSFIFLLFSLLFLHSLEQSVSVYDPQEAIDKMNIILTENYFKDIINNTIEWVGEYAFTDILKAPPKVEGYSDYFPSVDLIQELEGLYSSVNNETRFYQFYQKIFGIIRKSRDMHVSFRYEGHEACPACFNLGKYYIVPPVRFATKKEEGQIKVTARINPTASNLNILDKYKNFNQEVIKQKLQNNIGVRKINDLDPIEYLTKWGEKYLTLRNKNAQFTYVQYAFQGISLRNNPLDASELTQLKIEFTDDTIIDTHFLLVIYNTVNSEEESFFEFVKNNNPLIKQNDNIPYNPEREWEKYFKKYPHKNINKIPLKVSAIPWNYISEDQTFKCRVDKEKGVNVYYQNSFSTDDLKPEFLQGLLQCVETFSTNDYPIVVIEDLNGGGYAVLSAMFQECVQPLFNSRNLYSIRHGSKYTYDICEKLSMVNGSFWNEPMERYYNEKELNDFLNDAVTEKYSETVEHKRTKQKLIEVDFKESFGVYVKEYLSKKRRKPTQVLIFTDGFSYSATSLFIKSLQDFGGAITVGYNGHPNSTAKEFDASQSPTFILGDKEALKIVLPGVSKLEKSGFMLNQFSYGESFKGRYAEDKNEVPIPQEFKVNPVDERLDILEPYSDDLYFTFIDEAKRIFKKYETECNYNNPNLKNLNPLCDVNFPPHTHGGNTCGEYGKWSDRCEPFYCDDTYFFDYNTKTCVKDETYQIFKDAFINEYITEIETEYSKTFDEKEKYKKQKDDYYSSIHSGYIPAVVVFSILTVIFIVAIIYLFLRLKAAGGKIGLLD